MFDLLSNKPIFDTYLTQSRQNDYNTHSHKLYFLCGCDANGKLLIRSRKNFFAYSFNVEKLRYKRNA